MKKLFIILAMFLAVGFFTSCEEDEEPAQTLTAFVIGEWESQDLMMGDTEAHFLVDIEEDHYTLTLVVGDESAELPDEGYTVDDDASTITIDQPQMPGEEPSDDVVTFKVTWMEGGDTMTWLPVDPLDNDVPTLVWTRSTGM